MVSSTPGQTSFFNVGDTATAGSSIYKADCTHRNVWKKCAVCVAT